MHLLDLPGRQKQWAVGWMVGWMGGDGGMVVLFDVICRFFWVMLFWLMLSDLFVD